MWCGVVWCGVVWCDVVWCCGVVWCGVVGAAELQCLYLWHKARPCRQRHYSPLKQPGTACTVTHFHIPQDLNLQQHCCENLKSPKTFFLLICKWSEHHWLSVSTKCTIFCKPYSTHRPIRHTKFLVCTVGWGGVGGELLTCEAPVHKDLLNKMAEQHSFVLVMLTFFCIKRDGRNLCSTFQGKVCVLWSAKYGKLVIWCSSDSPTWQLCTLIQNDTFHSNQTIQLCLEVKIQNKKHRNEICKT